MDWLVTMLLGNLVIAGALALVALTTAWLRRPAVAHGIWLLVLVKLVTPPIVRVAGDWGMEPAKNARPAAVATIEPFRAGLMPVSTPVNVGLPAAPIASERVRPSMNSTVGSTIERARIPWRWSFAWLVGAAWVGGSIAYGVWMILRVKRFCDLLKQAAPANAGIAEIVEMLSTTIGLRRTPEVRVIDRIASPMMFSLGRAVMVLPTTVIERLSPDQQRAIIAHELAHLRRGDHWVRWIELLATLAMWWHPLLWLARRGLHEAEEQCCDAWVVATMPQQQSRRAYADALVDVLEMACPSPLPAMASGLGRITHLKRRLTMILDRTPAKSMSFTGKVVVVLLAALLPLAPVRGDAPANTGTKPTSAIAPVDDSTRKAVESLLDMAQDQNEQVRSAGMSAIARFGPKAVPVLIDALRRENVAPLAQGLLPQMGVQAAEALIEAVESPEATVRERSLLTLVTVLGGQSDPMGSMGAEGGMAPMGMPGMEGAAPGMAGRGAVAVGPGFFQPNGTTYSGAVAGWAAAPAAKASTDADARVRRAAVRLLGAIANVGSTSGDKSIAQALAGAMKDEDPSVRRLAAGAMVSVARFAPELSAALAVGVGDSDQSVRVSALTALGSVGPAAKDAMPVVTAALKDANPAVRIAAANALGEMNSAAASQLPGAVRLSMNPGFEGGYGGMAPPSDGSEVFRAAQDIYHWCKTGRFDLAKREADKILKAQAPSQTLFVAFAQAAQERNEDLSAWVKQMKNVKELKELLAELDKGKATTNPATPLPGAGF